MRRRAKTTAPGRLVILAENCRGCRSCQLACSFVRTRVFNPGRSMITMERNLADGRVAPMIKPIGCDLCGGDPACANACKYGAITYERGASEEKIVVRLGGKGGS
jgi:carbon-monoxide dehydrogenase iron sulfur subunit